MDNEDIIKVLKGGGVVVMPTDTIYGMVGRAENEETVERIYTIRKRPPEKPCIILVADVGELIKFGISLSPAQAKILEEGWPIRTSIIFDRDNDKKESQAWIHRGTNTLAIRVPAPEDLQRLLKEVGPLLAPSANPHGLPPAGNIAEAKKYFGNEVDLYVDGGTLSNPPSKILRLHADASVTIVRD